MQFRHTRIGPCLVWAIATAISVYPVAASSQQADGWEIGTPIRSVGLGEVEADYFQSVSDAALLPDGRLAVLDQGLSQLLIYPPSGHSGLLRLGRPGDGPGEFRRPKSLTVTPTGELQIFDEGLQRLSTFDSEGELRSDMRVSDLPIRLGDVVTTSAGRRLARSADRLARAEMDGLAQDTVTYFWLTDDAGLDRVAQRLPGIYIAAMAVGSSGRMGYRTAPFSPSPVQAPLGRCVVVAASSSDEVFVLSPDSESPLNSFSTGRSDHPVSASDWDAWKRWLTQDVPAAAGPEAEEVLEELPRPSRLPVYKSLIVDPEGLVWLQRYAAPEGFGTEWEVFTARGRRLTTVEFPGPVEVLDIGEDFVITVRRSDLREPIVSVHDLQRPDVSHLGIDHCGR